MDRNHAPLFVFLHNLLQVQNVNDTQGSLACLQLPANDMKDELESRCTCQEHTHNKYTSVGKQDKPQDHPRHTACGGSEHHAKTHKNINVRSVQCCAPDARGALECRLYLHRITSTVITELTRGLNIPIMDHDDVFASPSNRMAKALLCLWWNERCGVMWLSGLLYTYIYSTSVRANTGLCNKKCCKRNRKRKHRQERN